MYVRVRRFDSDHSEPVSCSSIKESIVELKKKVADKFNVVHDIEDGSPAGSSSNNVRLFFDGKELLNSLSIFHYGIKPWRHHVIQALFRQSPKATTDTAPVARHDQVPPQNESPQRTTTSERKLSNENPLAAGGSASAGGLTTTLTQSVDPGHQAAKDEVNVPTTALTTRLDIGDEICADNFYAVGEYVDAQHPEYDGAWFEARIESIRTSTRDRGGSIYSVGFIKSSLGNVITELDLNKIRPQSNRRVPVQKVRVGDLLLANFNLDQAHQRGLWYDVRVTKKEGRRLLATVMLDGDGEAASLEQCWLRFPNELYAIHENVGRDKRDEELNEIISNGTQTPRLTGYSCNACKDRETMPCKSCCCRECGDKRDPETQIICDECQLIFHAFTCLPQPLDRIPDDDWYCPDCKNNDAAVIQRRQFEHLRKKSAALGQKNGGHWGRGRSCAGRSISSVYSGKSFFGPIPGIEVGTWWRFRVQASEAGVHSPLVAGICGKENAGACSIVVSCTYADDIDLGDDIFYTGSGGRGATSQEQPTAKKRGQSRVGGVQTSDQELRRSNKALAMSCYAAFDDQNGASAGDDWRLGKPVRVLRSGNSRGAADRSLYLPAGGVRYDGIYKVLKYWPERNADTSLLVWRFHLRRDDPTPAPWTKKGKARIKRLGLDRMLDPPRDEDNMKMVSLPSLPPQSPDNICPICLDELRNPVGTRYCRHRFCQECISAALRSGNKECPTCRKKLSLKRLPSDNDSLVQGNKVQSDSNKGKKFKTSISNLSADGK